MTNEYPDCPELMTISASATYQQLDYP